PEEAPTSVLGERSGAPSGLRPSSFVMCNTPVEVQFTSAGCLNYPCRTPVLCGMGGVAWFAGFGSAGIENTAAPTLDGLEPFHTTDFEVTDAPQPAPRDNADVGNVEVAITAELMRGMPTDSPAASDEPKSIAGSALTNSSEMVLPETRPV